MQQIKNWMFGSEEKRSHEGPSLITIPEKASTLTNEELKNKIKGIIYGQAVGDAVGLATEFLSKSRSHEFYGDKEFISYEDIRQDAHRRRWARGDWTDDTDQAILILDGLLENGGKVSEVDFAQRLLFWVENGFPELGDTAGLGLGQTVGSVVMSQQFVKNPHFAAKIVWERSGRQVAPNGGVMRTSILGIPEFHNIDRVIENTKKICLCTHADPRCIASCVAVTSALAYMLQGETCNDTLYEKALALGRSEITERLHLTEFDEAGNPPNLEALKLDESDKIGYTFKCFGSGFYCWRNGTNFKKAINDLVMEGGDSDTNGAVAGALLGCKLGYDQLPEDWVNGLVNKQWLDQKVENFFKLLGL